MKILHWDEMFHPSFGYQINVLSKFQAKQGHEVIILTSEKVELHPTFKTFGNNQGISNLDQQFTEKYHVQIIRLPIHGIISSRVIYKRGYIERIVSLKPDVIMCHTNDTLSAMRIVQRYKSINIPIVFDNHMLEMASRNPLKEVFRWYFRKFITPIIVRNKWKVIKTQDDNFVNKHLGIPAELTPFISFGSDTTLFFPDEQTRSEMRRKLEISDDDFVVIYAGKLTEQKGGKFLAESINEQFETSRNLVFVIVGNSTDAYGEEVEKILSSSKNRILRFPTQEYLDLPPFFQMSDLCVFPKQVSLSFFDAQACGVPVISVENNINRNRLQFQNGFNFVEDNQGDFREKIIQCANLDNLEFKKMRENSSTFVQREYDYYNIAMKYTEILESEVERFNHEIRN